jgi:hypothetical protein
MGPILSNCWADAEAIFHGNGPEVISTAAIDAAAVLKLAALLTFAAPIED